MERDLTHFHSEYCGCEFEDHVSKRGFKDKNYDVNIQDKYCIKHKIVCCRCGWEWGHHNGTNSKTLTDENKL